jgi:hypothetical protein
MNSSSEYSFFGHPVSKRMFHWSFFLAPGLWAIVYLSSRSRGARPIRFTADRKDH